MLALRERQKRNLLATLLLSQGTPMILAGDEFGRTQQGNNNAYCQDNEISWVNWDIPPAGQELLRFARRLTRLRRTYPILRRERFLTGAYNEEFQIKDVTWITPAATEMTDENWSDGNSLCLGVVLDGRAQPTGIHRIGSDRTLMLILNAYHDMVTFTLPTVNGGDGWIRLIDTNVSLSNENEVFGFAAEYAVTGRSLLLFELKPEGGEPPID